MTADIELLPLPEHTEAGEFTFDAHVFEHMDMVSYARANVAHATEPLKAEIEALREDVASWKAQAMRNLDLIERLEEALRELVALGHPRDPAIIAAKNALRDHDQEEGSGAFWGSSPKSGGPDWTGFDG